MVFYNLKKFNFQLVYDINTFISSDMSFLGASENLGRQYEYGTGIENASVNHSFKMASGGNRYYLPEFIVTYFVTPKVGVYTGLKFRTSSETFYELKATSEVDMVLSEYNAAVSYDFYFVHLGCLFQLF
jgi:hypothetical protein